MALASRFFFWFKLRVKFRSCRTYKFYQIINHFSVPDGRRSPVATSVVKLTRRCSIFLFFHFLKRLVYLSCYVSMKENRSATTCGHGSPLPAPLSFVRSVLRWVCMCLDFIWYHSKRDNHQDNVESAISTKDFIVRKSFLFSQLFILQRCIKSICMCTQLFVGMDDALCLSFLVVDHCTLGANDSNWENLDGFRLPLVHGGRWKLFFFVYTRNMWVDK